MTKYYKHFVIKKPFKLIVMIPLSIFFVFNQLCKLFLMTLLFKLFVMIQLFKNISP
jgi:hypothetical protein